MNIINYFLAAFLLPGLVWGQSLVRSGEMEMQVQIQGDSLWVQLSAPTTGWLAVGFHHRNDIVGSDLLQFRVVNGRAEGQDQFVLGPGNHPPDSQIGGEDNLRLLSGTESAEQTCIRFKLPLQSGDERDFAHDPSQRCWLILAWSVSDDFDHHSRYRQHIPFHLPPTSE